MYSNDGPLAICDANVLIDYVLSDEDVLREIALYWKDLLVPDCILQEVSQLTLERAEALGITILATPLKDIKKLKGLSLEDSTCLYYVESLSAVCISNDTVLRKYCQDKGYTVIWGLEMLLLLIKEKKITKARGLDVASKIHECNPEITSDILKSFVKKCKSIK
ncbi:MAG: hypothetical protein JXN62_12050 [Bacteroidales bacterium]|nr:hypothetical protein [Bacteroidales bacterium]